jgi:hypothetical protein
VSVTRLDLRSLRCVRCDAVLTLHEQMRDHIGEVGRARAVLRVSDGVRDVRVVLEVGVDAVPAVREVDLSSVGEAASARRSSARPALARRHSAGDKEGDVDRDRGDILAVGDSGNRWAGWSRTAGL